MSIRITNNVCAYLAGFVVGKGAISTIKVGAQTYVKRINNMKAVITEIVNNYELTGILICKGSISEYLTSRTVSGEIVCENEYGSKHLAAMCIIEGCPSDMLAMLEDVSKSDFGYQIYPIDIFDIEYM